MSSTEEAPTYPGLTDLSIVPPMGVYLRDMWSRRAYAVEVPRAEYRSQNLHTALGQLWHLLNPALQMGVYYLMFGLILETDRGVDNFLVFLACGLFAFRLCVDSAVKGSTALTANLGLIRSLRFPRALLPVSATIGRLLTQGTALLVLGVLALATGEPVRWQWTLMVPILLVQAFFCFGLASWTARFSYQWGDLPNLLPFAFRLAFYVSGVLYSVENFVEDERVLRLFQANPFYVFIELWRYCFLDTPFRPVIWVSAIIWATLTGLSGLIVFKRAEGTYGQG